MTNGDSQFDRFLDRLERQAADLRLDPGQSATAPDESAALSNPFGRPASFAEVGPGPGDVIDETYEVQTVLGVGQMATVYLVRHTGVDRLFALKMLTGRAASDPTWVARFREEARATSLTGHENIVFVTDIGQSDEFGDYLVMEYLDGDTLEDILSREGAQPLERAVHVALQAGAALAAVHELGIVHRDLKPANIMNCVLEDDTEIWKLLDFGISNRVVEINGTLGLYGTPAYVAPEQTLGVPVDHRADQFSLAVVLYEMLVGEPPWSNRGWLHATPQAYRPPSRWPSHVRRDLRKDVAERVDEVLRTALARDPEQRWPDIEAFVEALQRASEVKTYPTLPPIDRPDGFGPAVATSVIVETLRKEAPADEPEPSFDTPRDVPSVEVKLASLTGAGIRVTMTFRDTARLRREYRRNIISGGLFVPTRQLMPVGASLGVVLRHKPTGNEIVVDGEVVSASRGNGTVPAGLGVALEEPAREAIRQLLRRFDLELSLEPSDVVAMARPLDPRADLTAGEAFLYSRLDAPMTVGALRALFAGVPFDFDQALLSLVEKEFVAVDAAPASPPKAPPAKRAPAVAASPAVQFSPEEVDRVLQRAQFFREQGNYLAENEILERAAEHAEDARILYRLAIVRAQFQKNLIGARRCLERAQELAPEDDEVAQALDELSTFGP